MIKENNNLMEYKVIQKSQAVIVHITDTYFIKESKIGRKIDLPGFGRIMKILQILEKKYKGKKQVLFLHSGDFLFPSFLSNFFNGKQIVDVLNYCGLNYCTLGNHDFDGGLEVLKKRITESKFEYILTNLLPPKNFSKNIIQYTVWPQKSPITAILGISGIMTTHKAKENGFTIINKKLSMQKKIDEITKKFPEIKILIILSHMDDSEDKELKKIVSGIWSHYSIILGGHTHNKMISYSELDKCMLVKGQSNARTIQLIDLDKKIINQKNVNLKKNLVILDSNEFGKVIPSKKMEEKIESWFIKLKNKNLLPSNKLVKKFPNGTILDITEKSLRNGTTNFGNFVTDCLQQYTESDMALINSGHFRSDRLLSEQLRVSDLFNTFVMNQNEVILVTKLNKKELMLFLRHSYSKVGSGKILQFSKNMLNILKNSKNNTMFRVSLISDMILSDEDGFGKILAQNRKISILKLRKNLKKDILKNKNLINCIIKTASKIAYDPKLRLSINQNTSKILRF